MRTVTASVLARKKALGEPDWLTLAAAGLVCAGSAWLVTLVGAILFRRFVDAPSIAFGKRFFEKVFGAPSPPAVEAAPARLGQRA